ncbi:MAG TPA: TolC family protein [Longimicrobiales bacterium]|nr:TolC family protein [Longimicrobiales bacterium]
MRRMDGSGPRAGRVMPGLLAPALALALVGAGAAEAGAQAATRAPVREPGAAGAPSAARPSSPASASSPANGAVGAPADTLVLSVSDAVSWALERGEEVQLARAQVELAESQIKDARAAALPQLSANLGYTRTFASQFDTGGSFTLPDSLKFSPDSTATLAERVSYLERRTPSAGLGGLGSLFGDLPFGRENAYTATASFSQLLYSGGRMGAALDVAEEYRDVAGLQLREQRAETELAVRTAYYHALLAGELERIADAAVRQAEDFLAQERLREKSGAAAELDVLRAEVALENLKPQLVQARNAAELATLDLRRLVNAPAGRPLKLTTPLEAPPSAELAEAAAPPETWLGRRAAVEAADRTVRMRELGVKIARGSFLPSVSLRMNYGRLAYPTQAFRLQGDWRTDWTAGLSVELPIFDGLRRNAQLDQAHAELDAARLQLAQLREGVQLQYEQARGERERAAATIAARQKNVTQAQRVYDLTVLRYDKGLATQLEVNDARLALLQARTNLAQALADYYIAEATVTRAVGGGEGAAPAGRGRR